MRQYVYENLPLSALKDHFDEIESSAYSVSLFTDWQKAAHQRGLDQEPSRARAGISPYAGIFWREVVRRATCTQLPNSRRRIVPSRWACLALGTSASPTFVWALRRARQRTAVGVLCSRQHAVEAILAVERLGDQVSPHLLISEIRAIAADQLWMSPCYEQPCVTIHFTWKPDWPAVSKLLPIIEKELAPFHARPHWGKLSTTSPAALQGILQEDAGVY